MASETQVKKYLAYWFQLGKKVVINNGAKTVLPQPVIQGDRYSDGFEQCWQQLTSTDAGDCYLEGTDETIAQLLTPEWEIHPCARCDMPVVGRSLGMPAFVCPCFELSNWPNTELPPPRSPVDTQQHLQVIYQRLVDTAKQF